MIVTRPRPTRSATLLSGSSSFPEQPSLQLGLRRSLTGTHWTLVEPTSHKPIYYVDTPEEPDDHPTREIRRGSSDGPILGTIQQLPTDSCQLKFEDGTPEIQINPPRKLSLRGHHNFEVDGKSLYWKRDVVCRESFTRRVFADTDGDTLLIYEGAEQFLDVIVAGFIAMKFKHQTPEARGWSDVFNVSALNM
jgi:hypothetical protein